MVWRIILTSSFLMAAVVACESADTGSQSLSPSLSTPELTATLQPTPSPSPAPPTVLPPLTPTTTPLPLPNILAGQEVINLEPGSPATLPAGVAIIVETGCWGCDGGAQGLMRYYSKPEGGLVADRLLDPSALGLPPRVLDTPEGPSEYSPLVTGIVMSPDASDIIFSVCVAAGCGTGGLAPWEAESRTTLMRSQDGGITWHTVAELGARGSVEVWTDPGEAVLVLWEAPLSPTFYRFRAADAAPEALQPPEEGAWPVATDGSHLLWLGTQGDRLLRTDGSVFVDLAGSGRLEYDPIVEDVTGFSIRWTSSVFFEKPQGTFGIERSFLSRVDPGGRIGQTIQYNYTARYGLDIGNGIRIGNASLDPADYPDWNWFPSLFDIPKRQVRPILDPFGQRGRSGRNIVSAVQHGPFVRVHSTGACLNVRAKPEPAAAVLACAADGVLLRDTAETREGDGITWLHVVTPDGVEGWSSTTFLDR